MLHPPSINRWKELECLVTPWCTGTTSKINVTHGVPKLTSGSRHPRAPYLNQILEHVASIEQGSSVRTNEVVEPCERPGKLAIALADDPSPRADTPVEEFCARCVQRAIQHGPDDCTPNGSTWDGTRWWKQTVSPGSERDWHALLSDLGVGNIRKPSTVRLRALVLTRTSRTSRSCYSPDTLQVVSRA